jgi:hypothetical protein
MPLQGKQTVKRHAITNRLAFHSVEIAPRAREFVIGEEPGLTQFDILKHHLVLVSEFEHAPHVRFFWSHHHLANIG